MESDAGKAGLNADERKEQRLKISYPTIRLFETWIKEVYLKILPNSKMGDAIEYTYSLLLRLSRYVNDGRYRIDNNLIENAIRPLALGRCVTVPAAPSFPFLREGITLLQSRQDGAAGTVTLESMSRSSMETSWSVIVTCLKSPYHKGRTFCRVMLLESPVIQSAALGAFAYHM